MSKSSDEWIFQVMVMARNKRLAERFLVLLRRGLLQRRWLVGWLIYSSSSLGWRYGTNENQGSRRQPN